MKRNKKIVSAGLIAASLFTACSVQGTVVNQGLREFIDKLSVDKSAVSAAAQFIIYGYPTKIADWLLGIMSQYERPVFKYFLGKVFHEIQTTSPGGYGVAVEKLVEAYGVIFANASYDESCQFFKITDGAGVSPQSPFALSVGGRQFGQITLATGSALELFRELHNRCSNPYIEFARDVREQAENIPENKKFAVCKVLEYLNESQQLMQFYLGIGVDHWKSYINQFLRVINVLMGILHPYEGSNGESEEGLEF
jgi:hypothetical protein